MSKHHIPSTQKEKQCSFVTVEISAYITDSKTDVVNEALALRPIQFSYGGYEHCVISFVYP